MVLVPVTFSIAGEQQYSRAFDAMAHEVGNLREPLSDTAEIIRQAVGEQFLTEGGFGGTPWAPLSPGYAKWKHANYPGRPILVRSGEMRSAFLTPEAAIQELTGSRLVWGPRGESEERALYHQTGAGHMPARKIIALNLATRRQIDRAFAEYVNDRRRRVFR